MNGGIVKLLVGMTGAERRNGGVESGGVAHAGVEIAGGEGAGHAASSAGARQRRAPQYGGLALVLGSQLAGEVDLGAGDVAVHVNAAGHDDQAGCVEDLVGTDGRVGWRWHHLAVLNPEILDPAVDAVGGVANSAVGNFQLHG